MHTPIWTEEGRSVTTKGHCTESIEKRRIAELLLLLLFWILLFWILLFWILLFWILLFWILLFKLLVFKLLVFKLLLLLLIGNINSKASTVFSFLKEGRYLIDFFPIYKTPLINNNNK